MRQCKLGSNIPFSWKTHSDVWDRGQRVGEWWFGL